MQEMQETQVQSLVQSLDWEDPLEEGMATHFSTLACRIPRTEELSRLQSMGSQSYSDMTEKLNNPCTWKMAWKTKHSTISLSLSLLLTLFCSLSPFLPFVSRVTLGKLLSPAQCLSLTICKMGMIAVPTS